MKRSLIRHLRSLCALAAMALCLGVCRAQEPVPVPPSLPAAAAVPTPQQAQSADTSLRSAAIEQNLSVGTAFLHLFIGAGVTFLLYLLVSGLHPLRLILGEDNRYSNSKFQVALWFFVVISAYVSTFILRIRLGWVGGIDIPENLLLLSGMSAFTYGAAKGITVSKVNNAMARGEGDPKGFAAEPSLLHDLTHNDLPRVPPGAPQNPPPNAAADFVAVGENAVAVGRVEVGGGGLRLRQLPLPSLDLGDAQMLIVTLLAAATYVVTFFYFLAGHKLGQPMTELPNVDNSVLTIFGLGHGAYLTKKAVGNAGTS